MLASRAFANANLALVSYGLMLLVFAGCFTRFRIRETYLLGCSIVVAVLLWTTVDNPTEVLFEGFRQGAFLMAFIFLVTLLHETALVSPAVGEFGTYLTRQPPGRSFTALFWGSNSLAVVFNLGIVSMLTPLIQQGNKAGLSVAGRDTSVDQGERRQYSAILRGLSWTVTWSPTAIAPVALMELIPGIDRLRWTLVGLMVVALVFLVAWCEDRWRFRHYLVTSRVDTVVAFPWSAFFRFIAAMGWLCLIIALLIGVSGDSIVFGLMMACPMMFIGWLLVHQVSGALTPATVKQRGWSILRDKLPQTSTVAVSLACSGFIGRVASALIPAEEWIDSMGLYQTSDFLILFVIPLFVVFLSWFALSPIMVAVFLGSVFGSLPELPTDPTLLALSISAGWALSMTSSPFATVVLLMSRMTGLSGYQLSIGWNWRFNLAVVALLFGVFLVL